MNPVHSAGWHLHDAAWNWRMYFRGEGNLYRDNAIDHIDLAGRALGNYDPPDPSSISDLILDRLDRLEDRLDAMEAPEPYDFERWIADLVEGSTPEAAELARKILKSLDTLAGSLKA